MRRLLRILLSAATALSLVACAAMGVFGFSPPTVIPYTVRAGESYFIANGNGGVRIVRQAAFAAMPSKFTPITSELDSIRVSQPSGEELPGFKLTGRVRSAASHAGFRWLRDKVGWQMRPGTSGGVGAPGPATLLIFDYGYVLVPYWSSIVVCGTLLLLGRITRRRVPRAGRCASCGYDLRATPGRCPECGTIPA